MLKAFTKVLLPIIVTFLPLSQIFADTSVDSMLSGLSLPEKIGQMILVYNSPRDFLEKHSVGGILLMQDMLKKPSELKKELQDKQARLKIPLLITIDQEGGPVNRIKYLPKWADAPSAQEMRNWPEDSIHTIQKKIADELRELKVNCNLAPVLDPTENHTGQMTYIARKNRTFGTATDEIVRPSRAFIRAFSDNNIGCIVKHFPGYDVTVNSDFKIAISEADSVQMSRNITPFRELLGTYSGIMMSSILYEKINNVPAVFSPDIVAIARKITPDGIIMTDDLWGVALRSFTFPEQKVKTLDYPDTAFIRIVEYSVKAGNDMLMITYPQKVPLIVETILKMADNDAAVLAQVNDAARRILFLKKKLNLFTD
jgi:beta-N-acetylhexosaminidase